MCAYTNNSYTISYEKAVELVNNNKNLFITTYNFNERLNRFEGDTDYSGHGIKDCQYARVQLWVDGVHITDIAIIDLTTV